VPSPADLGAAPDAATLPPLDVTLLHALRTRLTGSLPALVRAAVGTMEEDEIWATPREGMNAPGTLVRHCASAIRFFIGARIGDSSFVRDREDEFTAHAEVSKTELLADFDRAMEEADRAVAALAPAAVAGASRDAERRYTLLAEDLLAATVHLATHAGQLLLLAKLHGHSFGPDLWGEVHRASGAMRPPSAAADGARR
jgi:hypothetical protein